MLIVLPSTPTTEKASEYLKEQGVPHQVIEIPDSLGYKTGSDIGIYIESADHTGVPMELTKKRFIVMRVFKDFKL
jgi:hypothetical protein